MEKGKDYLLKLGTARVKMEIEEVIQVINAAEITSVQHKDRIELHDVAECILSTQRALAFDLVDTLAETSRFVIVDEGEICGGGIILADMPDSNQVMREERQLRETKWIPSDITPVERAQRYQQEPKLVVITGKRKTGRKTLARAIEKDLFQQGKFVYYLGMGSVVYGINQDIEQNGSGQHRREHIRRLAEVVHILMDSGLIVIVTALELDKDDLQLIETLVDHDAAHVVWVGNEISTDVEIDLHLTDALLLEERTRRLRELISSE